MKITDHYLCFQSAVRSLKDFFQQILLTNNFFNENDLLPSHQSQFQPGYSLVNQLLSLTHEICQSFDNDLEERGVFLDISIAFDKVWHEGLILKLSCNGISGNLLNVLGDL